MSAAAIVEQVRAAGALGQPAEVWGGGSILSNLPPREGVGRVDAALVADVVDYEPADLTITVGAGLTVAALDEVLAEHGQECPLDLATVGEATVGGRVATGLGGHRQLGCGPIRDWVLGMTFVTGDGRLCHAGGRTVKNVTGFDLPRLLCGSWGTLGVLVDVTLKVRPRPRWFAWYSTDVPFSAWAADLYEPATVLIGPERSWVCMEGHPEDAADQVTGTGLEPSAAPVLPRDARWTVPPGDLGSRVASLPAHGWMAEWGVGVVHLDQAAAETVPRPVLAGDGRLLLLGTGATNAALAEVRDHVDFHGRLKGEFDPMGVLAPWRFVA